MSLHRIRFIIFFGLAFLAENLTAQQLMGRVTDDVDGAPLTGATVELSAISQGAVTDENGNYLFSALEPGRYNLVVRHLGYTPLKITDVWIRNGKTTEQNISLHPSYVNLSEVEVVESMNPTEVGSVTINEEKINRFAATYYDPARITTFSPDVAVTNDQNNRVSVRGLSPNYNTWRLEGVEIVNPNHLSNAGTFSDQPAASGGGVNILSAQLLGRSTFLYGGYGTGYDNSVGGLFDMYIRDGSTDQHQYTAQASLIGLDFAAEGPFSKGGKASYIANYRYSFTGLLTNMGVDFGDESIGFQDFSYKMHFPLSRKVDLSFFGIGGLSFNNHNAKPFSESTIEKDRSDIYYDGHTGAIGMTLHADLPAGRWEFAAALSGSGQTRDQNVYNNLDAIEYKNNTDHENSIGSMHTSFRFRTGRGITRVGVMLNSYQWNLSRLNYAKSLLNQLYFNPYVDAVYPLSGRLQLDGGVSYNRDGRDDQALDPRLKVTYFASSESEFYAGAGRYSQLLNPSNYFFVYPSNAGDYYANYGTFNFINSYKYEAGFNQRWETWQLSTEAFYYDFPYVNVGPLNANSTATTYGLAFTGNRSFQDHWYMDAGVSEFNSTWDSNLDNRYNLKYQLTGAAGREWVSERSSGKRSFSANARLLMQGGLREPLPSDNSVVTTNNNDFFRLDFRVQWTRSREHHTTSLSLDLQNVTGQKNDAYQYIDTFTNQVEREYQLGLIPILTYRVEF